MTSLLDIKAYAIRTFFNFWGRLGSGILNLGLSVDSKIERDRSYGPDVDQRLDIYTPPFNGSKKLPIIVYFHGGGWISADKKIYDGIAATLSENDFLVFNVNYRLAPRCRFPAALEDAALAIDWIVHHLEQYNGDRSRIVLAGDSAGAQIAAWYACAQNNDELFSQAGIRCSTQRVPLIGLLLFYGVYDFDTVVDARFPFIKTYVRSFLGPDPKACRKNTEIASPDRHITHHLPPVFVCAGERDGLYAQSIAFAAALEKNGVSCHKLFLPRGYRADHGFLFFRWLSSSKRAFAEAGEFLRGL